MFVNVDIMHVFTNFANLFRHLRITRNTHTVYMYGVFILEPYLQKGLYHIKQKDYDLQKQLIQA